jgi:hypothetical protein
LKLDIKVYLNDNGVIHEEPWDAATGTNHDRPPQQH